MSVNLNTLPFNQETFICGHLGRGERPIAYVMLDSEATPSMTCGLTEDCDVEDVNNCQIACLGHMIEKHPDLREITALELSTEAWRDGANGWIMTPFGKENSK